MDCPAGPKDQPREQPAHSDADLRHAARDGARKRDLPESRRVVFFDGRNGHRYTEKTMKNQFSDTYIDGV